MKQETTGANLFESVPLDENKQNTRRAIESAATELIKVFNELPEGRHKSLAITNLEQAVMWANKGLSRAP